MNQRIQELMKQSGAYDYYEVNEGVDGDEQPMIKFAELIVKECAYLVNHQQRTTGYTTHAKMLCEEFGVEFKEEDYFSRDEE